VSALGGEDSALCTYLETNEEQQKVKDRLDGAEAPSTRQLLKEFTNEQRLKQRAAAACNRTDRVFLSIISNFLLRSIE
jgi:hypothetical protein